MFAVERLDQALRPIREVLFKFQGKSFVALVYGPPEDGAEDVCVYALGSKGIFHFIGMGVFAKRFIPASWTGTPALRREVDRILRGDLP